MIRLAHVPSVWAIRRFRDFRAFASRKRGPSLWSGWANICQPPPDEATPVANSIPHAEAKRNRPTTAKPAAVPSEAVAPESNPPGPPREKTGAATRTGRRILGSLLCGSGSRARGRRCAGDPWPNPIQTLDSNPLRRRESCSFSSGSPGSGRCRSAQGNRNLSFKPAASPCHVLGLIRP